MNRHSGKHTTIIYNDTHKHKLKYKYKYTSAYTGTEHISITQSDNQSHTIKGNEGAAFNLEIIFVHELSINIEIHFIMATWSISHFMCLYTTKWKNHQFFLLFLLLSHVSFVSLLVRLLACLLATCRDPIHSKQYNKNCYEFLFSSLLLQFAEFQNFN